MIAERTAKEREVGEVGDLGPYAQADIPDLPKPPYDFQVMMAGAFPLNNISRRTSVLIGLPRIVLFIVCC